MARPFTRNQHTSRWRRDEHRQQMLQDAQYRQVLWLHRIGTPVTVDDSPPVQRWQVGQWVRYRVAPPCRVWRCGQIVSVELGMGAYEYTIQATDGTRRDILDSAWHIASIV